MFLRVFFLTTTILLFLSAFSRPGMNWAINMQENLDSTRLVYLFTLAEEIGSSEPNQLIKHGYEARNLAESLGSQFDVAMANRIIGLGYHYQGKPDSALIFFEEAKRLFSIGGSELELGEGTQRLLRAE